MKKIIYVTLVFILAISMANAKPVTPDVAKKVAENFYKQNSTVAISSITLAYTEVDNNGVPLYYAFNINANNGFVIVSAEDATRPIIGYATKGQYVKAGSTADNFGFWMNRKSKQISAVRSYGLVAREKAATEWTNYVNNTVGSTSRLKGSSSIMLTGTPVVGPLMQSTWNQSPYYNAFCPGSTGTGTNTAAAVTGCVATTMAQIMRYWSYPPQGTGSSSYNCDFSGKPNYGTLSADYGTTSYVWANMPLANSAVTATTYSAIAQLMYQCGVSVDMSYDPSGSGAQVLGGNPSAQYSYKTYFGYNPSTLHGLNKSSFTDAKWIDTVKSDLNISRCVQYVGVDPSEGGHTWVCDGYDSNNYLHMNWGWGGASDGYFQVDTLQTPGFNPVDNDQVLLGIVPPTTNAYDAGIPSVLSPIGSYCSTGTNTLNVSINLENYGSNSLTACTINYVIDGVVQTPINWTGSLVSYQVSAVSLPTLTGVSSGTHTLQCYTTDPDGGIDQNNANDTSIVLFTVTNGAPLPVMEGFETASTLPNANWNVFHSATNGVDFAVTSVAAATGVQSCMLNNLNNVGGDTSVLQTTSSYNLSTFTTPSLTFKAAYEKQSTANNADKLQILTSTDCGNTWLSRKVITSATLASAAGGTGTTPYVPTPAQFTTYAVTISAVASSTNVMFRWAFIADPTAPGNNLFIDDINIVDATAGIESIEESVGLNLYPNPSIGKVNIDFNLSAQSNVSVVVTDMLGRTVETIPSTSYQAGETTLVVGANNAYQAGVYLVNINIDGQHIAKKVIIQ